jgi:hypothetical protein
LYLLFSLSENLKIKIFLRSELDHKTQYCINGAFCAKDCSRNVSKFAKVCALPFILDTPAPEKTPWRINLDIGRNGVALIIAIYLPWKFISKPF